MIIRRLGSVKRISLTPHIEALTELEKRRWLEEDAFLNAAEMLDPAMFGLFSLLASGGVEEDAVTQQRPIWRSCAKAASW